MYDDYFDEPKKTHNQSSRRPLMYEEPESEPDCYSDDDKKMFNDNCPSGGFTLLELMILIVIIGILATVAIPKFKNAKRKSEISREVHEMTSPVFERNK